ncbi:MAG: hypothetical protein J7J67_02560 [Thermoproteales archaeon]|nr:hypothetical protein [Thermoproteales archaeon]
MLGVDFYDFLAVVEKAQPSLSILLERLNDPSVQQLVQKIPEACSRKP